MKRLVFRVVEAELPASRDETVAEVITKLREVRYEIIGQYSTCCDLTLHELEYSVGLLFYDTFHGSHTGD